MLLASRLIVKREAYITRQLFVSLPAYLWLKSGAIKNNYASISLIMINLPKMALLLVTGGFLAGCTLKDGAESESWKVKVSYHDRNGDGVADLETHTYIGIEDADWALRDDDFDGRYEKKALYGFAASEIAVDLPVPVGVKLEQK